MSNEEWAVTSIVVFGSTGDVAETIDVPGPTLESQFVAAETWLCDNASTLNERKPAPSQVRLYSSWTPAQGQRAMTLPPTLIEALANVGGVFWMDVYSEGE